jgi:hypothetical protein
MKPTTTHDPMLRDAFLLGMEVQCEEIPSEAERWHRAYQIVSMGLAVSVVVNVVAIFWR